MLPTTCLIMLSPRKMTFSKRPRISQISSVVNQRMSQPRGMYGASMPMRPPDDMAVNMDLRSRQRGEKDACSSRDEMSQGPRYV